MILSDILLILLVLFVIGSLPSWPHSKEWGYWPSGILGFILIVFLILMLAGHIRI